jgi:hypothetical protein
VSALAAVAALVLSVSHVGPLNAVFRCEAAATTFICRHVMPGTIVNAEEATSWDGLHAKFEMKQINHQEAYSLNGAGVD